MDYKVLYRKYRPINFQSIVGQDYTVKMLKNAIIHNKISHAYLFTGPRGTGKTSTAKVFAKTINCEHLVDGEACGTCNSCLNFAHSSDIIEIDAASNNGVDDIRELINNVKIAPSESRYKIYIIDEVHMMTQSAFNALLLTLEEPPSHAIFIMATTNVESVPITILSRCQRFNFKKIALEDIVFQINKICEEEQIAITPDAIHEIAYLSEGGLRDALSLLDQLSSTGEEITVDKIVANYGSISSLFIRKLVDSLETSNVDSILEMMHELELSSSDYKIFIKKLIAELVHKSVQCKKDPRSTVFNYEQLKGLIFELNDCMNKVSIHLNPYTLIETILLSYTSGKQGEQEYVDNYVSSASSTNILESSTQDVRPKDEMKDDSNNSVTNLENEAFEDSYDEEMTEYLEELKNIRINNCFATAKKECLKHYQTVLSKIANESSFQSEFGSFLLDATVVAAGENVGILATPLESTSNLINHHLEEIEAGLEEFFGRRIAFISLSTEEWNGFKNEYIQNLKKGVKYEVIDESGLEELKPKKSSQLEEFATQIFGSDKIQVI